MNRLRFWMVVLLLGAAVALLSARASNDFIPAREPLAQLPETISGWTATDLPIDQETLDVLGSGDFLSRDYTREGAAAPIDLFIGYFPTQRTGSSIHSPQNCLPGSGWAFDSSSYVDLDDAKGRSHRVGEYVISNGTAREFVIYWYEAHGRSVASEYRARIYMVTDALRLNRTDGALVRIITPIAGADVTPARTRAEKFAAELAPMLTRYIPA
jgi:EpsI family protein